MKSYKDRMKAEQDRKLALLAAPIQKALSLIDFEMKYGKIRLN